MYSGRIVRTRRNPASQTIILSLSQCSSKTLSDASLANPRMSHFPVNSGKSPIFAPPHRLTGGLPDVGTDGALRRNLIRLTERLLPAPGGGRQLPSQIGF